MTILHTSSSGWKWCCCSTCSSASTNWAIFSRRKWRGLKVERFAIWFGKPIWKKKIDGVEYALGWIPAGGYVALPQMATMEAIEGKAETPAEQLPNVSPLDKIIVAFAGPLFSFVLAIVFAFVVWGVGKPSNEARQFHASIGWVDPTGPGVEGRACGRATRFWKWTAIR